MIDVAVVDWGTPGLAARCVGSLTSDLFTSIDLVDAKSRGWSYAQSVNRSLARGTAPYVLALNADTRMLQPPDSIIRIFEENPDVAVLGPRQITAQGLVVHGGIIGNNLRREHRYWMRPLPEVAAHCGEPILDVPTISGSVYFARRSVWEKHGGFLETCPHFYEETALDFSIRHAGHRVVYTGTTTWEHLFSQSPVDEEWRRERAAESRQAFRTFCANRGIQCD